MNFGKSIYSVSGINLEVHHLQTKTIIIENQYFIHTSPGDNPAEDTKYRSGTGKTYRRRRTSVDEGEGVGGVYRRMEGTAGNQASQLSRG